MLRFLSVIFLMGVCFYNSIFAYETSLKTLEDEAIFGWPQLTVPDPIVEHENTYISSLWSQCIKNGLIKNNNVAPEIEIQDIRPRSNLLKKPLPIQQLFQRDSNRRIVKAPLVVYFHGVFGFDKNKRSPMMRKFHGWGYHVISMPHPWSSVFIKSKPQFSLSHLQYEAKVLLDIITKRINQMEASNHIENVHFVGLSHGSMLATAAAALNSEQEDPLTIEGVTGISPVHDILVTAKLLDTYIDQTEKRYRNLTGLNVIRYAQDVCQKHKKNLKRRIEKAKTLVAWIGFQNPIVNSLYLYEKEVGLPQNQTLPHILRRNSLSKTYEFKTKLRLKAILKNYFPDVIPVLNEKGNLNYWISKATNNGFRRFRYIVSENDFLNSPNVWPNKEKRKELAQTGVDFIVLPYGGHYGFSHKSWFWNFIHRTFELKE